MMKRIRTGVVLVLVAMCLTGPLPSADASGAPGADQIAYTWNNADFTSPEIGVIGTDGSRQRLLTREPGFDVAAAWSPDGRRIAFTSSRSQPAGDPGPPLPYSELYVMNADGTHVRRITNNVNLVDYQPAWSPDGRRIVVARGPATPAPPENVTGPTDLWIIDLASGREQQVTNNPNTWEGWPHWSPDGNRIAFQGDLVEPGNEDVYTIRTDGTGLRRLTSRQGFDGDVRYSPDGRSLVFDMDRRGNVDIFVMRTDGTSLRRLTSHPGADYYASYSPDGRWIAFSSDRDGTGAEIPDIFRMRADGSHQVNLSRTPSLFEFDAEWQPR